MTKEIEFEKWWAHTGFVCDKVAARYVWNAAWTAERLDDQAAWDKGYAAGAEAERKTIEAKILAMAGAAFVAGKDDHAHWFRSLVNVLFKKPGDKSA